MYGLKYMNLGKGNILRLKKSIKTISTIWTNCCFFCEESQILEQTTFKKVGITVVGLYPRMLYILYLYHYTNTCMQLVVWLIFGHQDIVPVNSECRMNWPTLQPLSTHHRQE